MERPNPPDRVTTILVLIALVFVVAMVAATCLGAVYLQTR